MDAGDGTLRWEVGFDLAGEVRIPVTVTAGAQSVDGEIVAQVLNANGAPSFDGMQGWSVEEGQTLVIQAFAFDPDNPSFQLPTRDPQGDLIPPDAISPITYEVVGLPEGAEFDPETATLRWTPNYQQSGDYVVQFLATDDGDSAGEPITIESFCSDFGARDQSTSRDHSACQSGSATR